MLPITRSNSPPEELEHTLPPERVPNISSQKLDSNSSLGKVSHCRIPHIPQELPLNKETPNNENACYMDVGDSSQHSILSQSNNTPQEPLPNNETPNTENTCYMDVEGSSQHSILSQSNNTSHTHPLNNETPNNEHTRYMDVGDCSQRGEKDSEKASFKEVPKTPPQEKSTDCCSCSIQ